MPRYVWATVAAAAIYFVCAIAGLRPPVPHLPELPRPHGATGSPSSSRSCWRSTTVFRRHVGFDWTAWEDLDEGCPPGSRPSFTFLVGWVGPDYGHGPGLVDRPRWSGNWATAVEIWGIWLGIAFSGITFPPLRYWELKKFGR